MRCKFEYFYNSDRFKIRAIKKPDLLSRVVVLQLVIYQIFKVLIKLN
jgi:hypothetical protein